MSDDTALTELRSLIGDARLAYGTVLIDDEPTMVECIDRDRFESEAAVDMGLATAYASINADLIPFVMDHQEEFADIESAVGGDPARITGFDDVTDVLEDARAYYLLINTEVGTWKRVRNVVADRFDDDGVVTGPDIGRFVVASTLVDEARERIGDLPESVDGEEIGVIDWSA
jgi:hypothetical protein